MNPSIDFAKYRNIIGSFNPFILKGKVNKVVGLSIESNGPIASIGDLCTINIDGGIAPKLAEVVGFRGQNVLLMPLGDVKGISVGCEVISESRSATVSVGNALLGRVIDGMGEIIDDKGVFFKDAEYPLYNKPTAVLKRRHITEPLDLGIRSVNGLLTCGKGQRISIIAGTGVGKSTLLGMISRYTNAEVTVIALIGERGREVRHFIDKNLGKEGMKKTVVVVATSDQPPLVRMRGAFVATAVAEYFRDQGKDVLLLMDSVTRFAMAQREIGLSIGEPPTTKGYTPSVFAMMPQLLERAGTTEKDGSITGIYTVLVEGDDINDPISDSVRSIIDGHIVLSRKLISKAHYPPIDVLNSISRVMIDVVSDEQMKLTSKIIEVLATYQEAEDLINIGAYVKGSNPKIDFAIANIDAINQFLKQGIYDKCSFKDSFNALKMLMG